MSAAPAVTLSSSCWSMSVISPPFFLIVRDFEFRDFLCFLSLAISSS
jgi:hypothetical protein